jgi:tetratricopeptide (TPR) repeat protein
VLGLITTLSALGCGRALVFVKYQENIKPEVQEGGVCIQNGNTPESFVAEGDRLRAGLLAALPGNVVDPSGPYADKDTVALHTRDLSARMQQEVNNRYQLWRNARACYSQAVRLDPNISYAYVSMGVISLRMADLVVDPATRTYFLTSAQGELARAKQVNRFDGQPIYYQAELEVRRGNWEAAQRNLQELIDKKWDRANVHNLMGYVLDMTGRRQDAVREWQYATQLDDPPQSTNWAIERLRPPQRVQFYNADDDAVPKAYYQWNWGRQGLDQMTQPPPTTCGWAANGRHRCTGP